MSSERALSLIQSAGKTRMLSPASLETLVSATSKNSISLGRPVTEVKQTGDSVLLVSLLIDDSGSLGTRVTKDPKTGLVTARQTSFSDKNSNAEAVRVGHKAVVDALLDSQSSPDIWFQTRYLNGRELNPWDKLSLNTRNLDSKNYTDGGGTPLYDEVVRTLGSVVAKSQEFRNHWIIARTATLIVTDGVDTESSSQNSVSTRRIIDDMHESGQHIIAAMGIDDGMTNFRRILRDLGIRENLILTPGSTPEEIRRAFGLFAKLATQAVDPNQFNSLLTKGFLALPPGS